jgi:hypothetical protein
MCTQIAEQAVGDAVQRLCRGGSWLGLTRELGWRAVTVGGRDPSSLDRLCTTAEAVLGSLIDDAIWASELAALEGWHEYLDEHPGAEKDALAACTLDANEEAGRRIATAYASVLDTLILDGPADPYGRRAKPDALAA